jgi:two-component system, LytTR family, response regulator
MGIRALIVEDEQLARGALREFAAAVDGLDIVGEAHDGMTGVALIDDLTPDLVFLDIHLPGFDGLQVLERIGHEPAVIFTTAFDDHAVAAFELSAVDYILKPFGRERFLRAVERARIQLARGEAAAGGSPPGERLRRATEVANAPLTRLFLREGFAGPIIPVHAHEISHLEANDDYVKVMARGRSFLVEIPLSELEQRLDPARFHRIHRRYIVNLDQVEDMRPFDSRRLLVRMRDGSEVLASRSGSQRLHGLIL